MKFWIPWGIDALIALIFLVFFFIGIGDGTVSSRNIVLWLIILAGLGGIVLGGYALRSAGRESLAIRLLLVLAIPGFLVGVLMLAILILQPRWN